MNLGLISNLPYAGRRRWCGWQSLALVLMLSSSVATAIESSASPSVVVIVGNDFGWDDLPWNSGVDGQWPGLRRLLSEGMELPRFYGAPDGAASMASLLTGRYHYRTGVSAAGHGENVMHGYEITVAEVFRENGYATGFFGVWQNGRNWPSNAAGQGFGEVVDPAKATTMDEVVAEARKFCEASRNEPYFCWLALPALPADGAETTRAIDSAIADLLAVVGDSESALMLFTADNASGGRAPGDPVTAGTPAGGPGERGSPRLLGGRGSVHEGGVRVPFLVRWPGAIPAGAESREISAGIDLLPTLVELCGLDFVETLPLDGISLAELLLTGGEPRRWPNRILFTSATPPGFDLKGAAVAVRTGRWLAVREPGAAPAGKDESGDWQLFDLLADPFQRYDVAGEYWYLAGHLSADFSFWMKQATENGVGPLATEVGHGEWPVVTLSTDDVPYGRAEVADDGSRRWTWPVEIMAAGEYRLTVEWRGHVEATSREAVIEIADGDQVLRLGLTLTEAGRGAVAEDWEARLGEATITLCLPAQFAADAVDVHIEKAARRAAR